MAGITLTRSGVGSVTLEDDLDVERTVGRPESVTRHDADNDPYLVDRPRASADEFELSGTWRTNAAANQATLVEQIIKPPLGQDALTLDFGGLYGMTTFSVAPINTQAVRISWTAGEQGMVRVEVLRLIVVDNAR